MQFWNWQLATWKHIEDIALIPKSDRLLKESDQPYFLMVAILHLCLRSFVPYDHSQNPWSTIKIKTIFQSGQHSVALLTQNIIIIQWWNKRCTKCLTFQLTVHHLDVFGESSQHQTEAVHFGLVHLFAILLPIPTKEVADIFSMDD